MQFVKAHGTGNDFVVLADPGNALELTPALVRSLCDRHAGVGGDGVIRIGTVDPRASRAVASGPLASGAGAPDPDAFAARGPRPRDWFMDYRNADGSIAEMCGNGVRVVGKYLGDRGLVPGEGFDLETRAGRKRLELHRDSSGKVATVTVDMGPPSLTASDLPASANGSNAPVVLEAEGGSWAASCVSMGNPHAVVFVDDVDAFPVEAVGPLLERHPAFPNKTNVEFVQVGDDGHLRQRTWERGVGETLACGTGACAVAVAAQLRGLAGASVSIELRGGVLVLEWPGAGGVLMTGPAVEVATGTLDADWLEAHAPSAAPALAIG